MRRPATRASPTIPIRLYYSFENRIPSSCTAAIISAGRYLEATQRTIPACTADSHIATIIDGYSLGANSISTFSCARHKSGSIISGFISRSASRAPTLHRVRTRVRRHPLLTRSAVTEQTRSVPSPSRTCRPGGRWREIKVAASDRATYRLQKSAEQLLL